MMMIWWILLTFCIWVLEQDLEYVNVLSAGERITTDTNAKGLTKTDERCLVDSFVGKRSRARDNACQKNKRTDGKR